MVSYRWAVEVRRGVVEAGGTPGVVSGKGKISIANSSQVWCLVEGAGGAVRSTLPFWCHLLGLGLGLGLGLRLRVRVRLYQCEPGSSVHCLPVHPQPG